METCSPRECPLGTDLRVGGDFLAWWIDGEPVEVGGSRWKPVNCSPNRHSLSVSLPDFHLASLRFDISNFLLRLLQEFIKPGNFVISTPSPGESSSLEPLFGNVVFENSNHSAFLRPMYDDIPESIVRGF